MFFKRCHKDMYCTELNLRNLRNHRVLFLFQFLLSGIMAPWVNKQQYLQKCIEVTLNRTYKNIIIKIFASSQLSLSSLPLFSFFLIIPPCTYISSSFLFYFFFISRLLWKINVLDMFYSLHVYMIITSIFALMAYFISSLPFSVTSPSLHF